MKKNLVPKPLTKEVFKKYGEVVTIEDSQSKLINDGYAKKFFELCTMDTSEKSGDSTLHIYVAKKREFPLCINMLEKHPFFSQTFMPRTCEPFLVVVALGDDKPDLSTLSVFKTNGNQGVHYNRGVWHFPLISLKDKEQFVVIDRTDSNKSERKLQECIELKLEDEDITITLETI